MTNETEKTEVSSYFISNYPPYSAWNESAIPDARAALETSAMDVPLGLYLHIPFCRKRCKFCYFRVYTDRRAEEIEIYMRALENEIRLISEMPVTGARPIRFVYFGGGTPSFLSVKQLTSLFDRLRQHIQWDRAEEVTFECEPGTLAQPKVAALRQLGVTRLSLGVENFSDTVLEENGRAHKSPEIYRAWDWIQAAEFPNVNIDLIAGMVGESWDNWKDCIEKTVHMAPDSVTIYQMELPYNTVYSQEMLNHSVESPVASWVTKREWVAYAFEQLEQVGYHPSSAYTMVKDANQVNFSYRDNLWQGADLLATGVASFGHVGGVHYQNHPEWAGYVGSLERNELPIYRGFRPTAKQRMIRELILQLKRGYVDAAYFREKFQCDIRHQFALQWDQLQEQHYIAWNDESVQVSREGLLRIDALLPTFFEAEFQGVRYT